MEQLTAILREEVLKYGNSYGLNTVLFPLIDDERRTYAVNAVDYPTRKSKALVVVLARVVDNVIIVEEDNTDKKLVDALLQRGIDRKHIILAYNNESLPENVS